MSSFKLFLILSFCFLSITLSAQKLTFGVGYQTLWLTDKGFLKNNDNIYEKYTSVSPYHIYVKMDISKYGHVYMGFNRRIEKLKRYSQVLINQPFTFIQDGMSFSGTIRIPEDGLMYDKRLYLSEFSFGLGKEFIIRNWKLKIETGVIKSYSKSGKSDVKYSETPGERKFEDHTGEYLDANINIGIGFRLTKRSYIHLKGSYRNSLWVKKYNTYDLKYIYGFPSYAGISLAGVGLSFEYTLFN